MDRLMWRKGATEDEPLLLTLFTEARSGEFAPLGWPEEQLRPLLDMQYRARQMGYAQSYPAAVDMILCLENGTAAGRLLIERQPTAYRVIDIAVLTEYRHRGIGAWALRQIQQAAALERIGLRLSVTRNNPALRLYERLGFLRVSGNELSCEMEWRAPQSAKVLTVPDPTPGPALHDGKHVDREEAIGRILAFLREIGLQIHHGITPALGFLPGIQMVSDGLRVDLDALLYPGDLLHEAGRLAVMTPRRRRKAFPLPGDPAEEIAALAWSYAAALHVGIPPEVVFHDNGYRGQAKALLDGFAAGNFVGMPLLAWMGLTTHSIPGRPSIYPEMLRWMREAPPEAERADLPEDSVELQQTMAGSH